MAEMIFREKEIGKEKQFFKKGMSCMKKMFLAVFVVFVFATFATITPAGAVNLVDVDQTGTVNTANVSQAGTNQVIDVDQFASFTNGVTIKQGGNSGNIDLFQSALGASGSNTADLKQKDGSNHSVVVNQTSTSSYNTVTVNQALDADTTSGKAATVNQTANDTNTAMVKQTAAGDDTTLIINQTSAVATNDADTVQKGNSQIAVTQNGWGDNTLEVDVDLVGIASANTLSLTQSAPGGYNTASIDADATTGTFSVLGKASGVGDIDPLNPATQISSGSYNSFSWIASGGANEFGLYQAAADENIVAVNQSGGNNSLAAYQTTTGGSNSLTATQAGGKTATVYQSGSGDNIATISQL